MLANLLLSPIVMALAVLAACVCGTACAWPLVQHRKSVASTLDFLLVWSRGETKPALPHSANPLMRRLIALAEEGAQRERQLASRLEKAKSFADMAELASQVAHDLRSPLTALGLVMNSETPAGSETQGLMRASVARIHRITEELLSRRRDLLGPARTQEGPLGPVPTHLGEMLREIVQEHRLLLGEGAQVTIEFACAPRVYGSFACVRPEQLRRALSNLTQNAVEAIDGDGTVSWRLYCHRDTVCLQLEDTGCGMDAGQIEHALRGGYSFGKENGNGIGLCAAREAVLGQGGSFEVNSTPGQGTRIDMSFAAVATPQWCASEVNLYGRNTCVIIDDDPSVHDVWSKRLQVWSAADSSRTLVYFNNSTAFAASSPMVDGTRVFFIDFRLGTSSLNGLEIIQQYDLQSHAYLVTTDFSEPDLQDACAAVGVRLIPKGALSSIALRFD